MFRKIRHLIARIFGIIFIVFFLIVIGVIIFIMTFDLDRYKDFAAQKLTTILDHPVKIASMHTKLAFVPTITITGFKIENNDPFQEKAPLLSIQKMDAELELAPLLNSQINIHKIILDDADINLFKTKDANNWTLAKTPTEDKQTVSQKSTSKIDLQKSLHLNLVKIGTLNIKYDDAGKVYDASIKNLEMKNFHLLSGDIVYNKQTFTFTLNTGSLFDLLNQSSNFPYDLKVRSRLADITLNGKIGNFKKLSDLQTTLSLRTNNLKNMAAFFGIKHALIPTQTAQLKIQLSGSAKELSVKQLDININSNKDLTLTGTGVLKEILKNPVLNLTLKAQLQENKLTELWQVQPMSLSGDLTVTPTSVKTKELSLDANRSDARLAADIKFKDKVNISAVWASDFLNIYDFIKKQKPKSDETTPAAASNKKQEGQIPWQTLKQVNASLNLNVKHFQANDWFTDYLGLTTQASLYDGILKFPFELSALNGKTTGTINASADSKTISFNLTGNNLNSNGLRLLNQEIKDVVLQTKISGETKGSLFSSLLGNLNGRIIAEINQGEIINKWFVNLPKVLNLTKKKQNVSFSNTDSRIMITCAAANINIVNGIITGKDQLALETNTIDLIAGGKIDLTKKTMDVLMHPSLPENMANDWLDLSKYIRITGSFDKLTPRVDTEQVATNLLQAGVSKLMGSEAQTQNTTHKTAGAMCQNVLGKEALIAKKSSSAKTTTQSQPTKTQRQQQPKQKQKFEDQLLNSLFQALTPQQ